MAGKKPLLVYAAAYETVEAALADLDAIEQAHKDEVIGQYDAAVIERSRADAAAAVEGGLIRGLPSWQRWLSTVALEL
jgi:hypothetical protein